MKVRPWVVAAICLGTLAAWTPFSPPTAKRYRLDLKTSVSQDLTVLGQGVQTTNFSNTGYVTMSTQDSAGGQAVTLVLDSLVTGDSSPISPEAAKGAAGVKWHGFRQATGKVQGLKLEGNNDVAGAIEPALQQLIPPIKPGTQEGQVWTDTTDTENDGVAVRTVTNFQTSSEAFQGTKVLRLAGAFSSAMSGQRTGPQGTLTIEGTGTGTNSWLLGTDFTCLAGTHSAVQNLSLSLAQIPQPIPVTVKTEGTATLLK